MPTTLYDELYTAYARHEADTERACVGKSESEIVASVEALGHEVFYSRFGGWKFGRSDRDDDVSEGYFPASALYGAATMPEELAF